MNICLVDLCGKDIYYNSILDGCGGAESWLIQLSNAFLKRGNTVCIVGNIKQGYHDTVIEDNKVNYVSISVFDKLCSIMQFDFIIISRFCNNYVYNSIVSSGTSKYVFKQLHDLHSIENPENMKKYDPMFNKYVYLTPFHAKYDRISNNMSLEKGVIIPNGVDLQLFDGIDVSQKDNRILWCSNPHRGLYIIIEQLYDVIKKYIPDFGIDVCFPSYSKDNLIENEISNGKDIKIIGSLGKQELYKEMAKHKCWVYPQNFIDTFCIGFLENAMCDVNIVCPWWYAPGDIFNDITKELTYPLLLSDDMIYHHNNFNTSGFWLGQISDKDKEKYDKYLTKMCNDIISAILDYNDEYYVSLRNKFKNKVIDTYNWNNVALLYEQLYVNEKIKNESIYEKPGK